MKNSYSQVPLFNDVRDQTVQSRIEIGFSTKDAWRDAQAIFDEHTLTINGHPVMEDWEEEYMYTLASIASMHGGTVLEVGYGMGISARFIQEHNIEKHIVIEANKDVFKCLEDFAQDAQREVEPIFGFWEDVTHQIPSGSISGILFDTYPLTEEEIHRNHFPFFKEAYRILKPGGVLTYYSDEISDFSPDHREALANANFKNIQRRDCLVTPPSECAYWKTRTILAPIITK